jgi:hypothetical protein
VKIVLNFKKFIFNYPVAMITRTNVENSKRSVAPQEAEMNVAGQPQIVVFPR